MDDPVCLLLQWFIMTLWFLAIALRIARTSGRKDSVLHLVMFAEMAVPLLMCLFFEINALVFAVMIVAFLHKATALWDVSFASTRQNVTPIEQYVHSFLEMMPLIAGAFVAVMHGRQFLALFGLGLDWALSKPSRFLSPI